MPAQHPIATRPGYRVPPERASRYRGCLLAGAAGDALGAAVEFLSLAQIRQQFGAQGIRDFAPAYGRIGAITDDTQMTLFTADGILRAQVRGALRGVASTVGMVALAYQCWLKTQGLDGEAPASASPGWLPGHRELFARRAPGRTCIEALGTSAARSGLAAGNHSKGCGGVMRVAPVGLYTAAIGAGAEAAFRLGCDLAAITHGHPTGQLAAGALAVIVQRLSLGAALEPALQIAGNLLRTREHHEETLAAMHRAETLAASATPADRALASLGEGWVAEEALAIAVFCALRTRRLEEAVCMAVNISGDSDSTGSITGNLMGAWLGVHAIPDRWLRELELRGAIEEMADDLATVGDWNLSESGETGAEAYWHGRYPDY